MAVQDQIPDRLGPYRLRERIGEGGMGAVYLARDRERRMVAVKVLHSRVAEEPNARRRLAREVEVMRQMAMAQKDDAIAFNLNLSKHGVDFHIRNILEKLDAPNRMFAVMKAVNSGLLGLDEAAFIRQASRRGRSRPVSL